MTKASEYGLEFNPAENKNIMNTISQLRKHNYQAYIVGGAVRDMLLGSQPKDFDLATNAQPEEILNIFHSRSRSIGQRFPIVHVYFATKTNNRRDYVEITTLEGGMEADALRRDFTINAMIFDPVNDLLYDYVGAGEDIANKELRMIGAAEERLMEDPVRILRALRLATKLDLRMTHDLQLQLKSCVAQLTRISSPRLADEFTKVLCSGVSADILKKWQQFHVCDHILPILSEENPIFFAALENNDQLAAENRLNSYSFLTAALFWQVTSKHWREYCTNDHSPTRAMEKALARVDFRRNRLIPVRRITYARDLYFIQAQIETTLSRKRAYKMVGRALFNQALLFAALRDEPDMERIIAWWKRFASGSNEERDRMLHEMHAKKRNKNRFPPHELSTADPSS